MHHESYGVHAPVAANATGTGQTPRSSTMLGATPDHRFHAGMPVICDDGMLGYVERSLPTWQPHAPTHLVVRTGEHGNHAVIVPVRWTVQVSAATVRLRVRKRHIARRAQYQQHAQSTIY